MPIRPEDLTAAKTKDIPQAVFDAFDAAIIRAWDGRRSVVNQNEVATDAHRRLRRAGHTLSREQMFDNGWLDVEDTYRDLGWHVVYDKPGFNEDYPATFTFSRKS